MPVRTYVPNRPAPYTNLVDRLADEWRAPDATAAEPVILEEPDRLGVVRHVYVVWDAWAQLSREVRAEIIMDAADRVKPRPTVSDITIAMGLTADEADRFQIKWR